MTYDIFGKIILLLKVSCKLCTILLVLMGSFKALAINEGTGDEAPEPDVGLSAEATPMEKLDIREVKFAVAKGEPVIDGKVDEKFWFQDQVEVFELQYELYPTRLAPAPVKTEARVVLTKSYVYVAFVAHDPDIKELRSAPREHDGTKEDDYVSIIIDPSGQSAKKYEFRVNPHGALSDVLQDTISDRYIYDWDTEWTGEAQITETGYSVEIAIPVTSIRQPEIDIGEESKGIVILKRSYPRRIDRTLANFFVVSRTSDQDDKKPAQIKDGIDEGQGTKRDSLQKDDLDKEAQTAVPQNIEITDLTSTAVSVELKSKSPERNNFQITPYYIYHFDEERDIGGTFEQVNAHRENEVGFDAKYQIDDARSLTITANPNFTEVEADIARQSINNSFVVFQPEKREFFRDATEYYSTLLPIVYTRNIISPEAGASFLRTGTTNSSGIFLVRDEETNVTVPDTFGSDTVELDVKNTSVAFRHQYSKDKKTIGVLSTFRSGDNGYHNAVAGIDGLINLGIDDKLRYQVMYSDTKYPQSFAEDLCETSGCTQTPPPPVPCTPGNCDTNAQVLRTNYGKPLTDHALRISYRHDGPESLFWANYFDVAPDFRADLGYARKVDIRVLNFAYGRNWYVQAADDDAGKSRIRMYAIANHHRSYTDDNELESGITLLAEFRGTHQTVLRVARRHRDLAVNRIDQSSLSTGDNAPLFSEDYWFWYYQIAPSVKWSIDLNGKWGEVADADNMVLGDMAELKPKIKYRLGNLEYTLEAVVRDFEVDNQQLYREEFLTFGMLYRKNKKISHRLLLLGDKTLQTINHAAWLDKSDDERQVTKSLEYTWTYQKSKYLKWLVGFKLEREQENNSEEALTNREIYIKFQKRFDANI